MAKYQYRRSVSLSPKRWLMIKKLAFLASRSPTAVLEDMIESACEESCISVSEEEIEMFKKSCRDKRDAAKPEPPQHPACFTF